MSIEKMELVAMIGLMKYLDDTLQKCLECGNFHIEYASKVVSEPGQHFVPLQEENPYRNLLKKIVNIPIGDDFSFYEEEVGDVAELSMEQITDFVSRTSEEFRNLSIGISELENKITEREQALIQLKHLKVMDLDLGQLFKFSHMVVRFGKIPVESFDKLDYYDDKTFIFVPYDDDGVYKWGLYFAPKENVEEVDKIMKSLYFEKIWVPDFVGGTPESEADNLSAELDGLKHNLNELKEKRKELIELKGDMLNRMFCHIRFLHDRFSLRSYAAVFKGNFYLVGFIPKKNIQKFKESFAKVPYVSIIAKPAGEQEEIETPVKLKNNRFARPFSMFVEMYGLPRYNGFNPTTLVAITYTIMFGIMFGDLGQGLVVSLLGFLLYKKTGNALGAIMQRIGISSAVFGCVFGSVFGFEHVLDPVYRKIGLEHKPIEIMDNINLILVSAICIGVALIIVSILINIYVSLKHKDFTNAIFGNNGIAGLITFGSLLAGLAKLLLDGQNIFTAKYVIFLIVLPIIIMFFREPLGAAMHGEKYKLEGGIGDFIASNFFEVFEFMLGYATNTLSFVRIGGFVFSHAGMMSVVMLLADMAAKGASPIVIVLGNLFVIGMEGLIVGIQVLRLEFYEIFSRFYDGDGCAFDPVKINYTTSID